MLGFRRAVLTLVGAALLGAALAGCEGEEKKVDDSKPAPAPTYHMVPAQSDPNYKKEGN
jgi:hypothetical protein